MINLKCDQNRGSRDEQIQSARKKTAFSKPQARDPHLHFRQPTVRGRNRVIHNDEPFFGHCVEIVSASNDALDAREAKDQLESWAGCHLKSDVVQTDQKIRSDVTSIPLSTKQFDKIFGQLILPDAHSHFCSRQED
jgi:hypothetical protein